MRFQRNAVFAMACTLASRSFFSSAFTATPKPFLNTNVLQPKSQTFGGVVRPTALTLSRGGGGPIGLNMIFDKLFGSAGAYSMEIDYSVLGYPGDELGQMANEGKVIVTSEKKPNLRAATFAGGCFWGLELAYQRVPGVVYTAVGYTQGEELKPNYDQVCSGATGHTEAVLVLYDPDECKYEDLLDTYFNRVDPTTVMGQGNDRGPQYRTGVYTHTEEQAKVAAARFELEKGNYKQPIASELKEAMVFWPAEKYHQQYLEKGGRFGTPQSTEKGSTETIRCYG